MEKKAYVVNGSEDGVLGVFTNYKRAYEKAISYVSAQQANSFEFKDTELGTHSYATTQRHCKKYWSVGWTSDEQIEVQISMHIINR